MFQLLLLNIKRNFVIMICSVSTKTKQTILNQFLDEIFRLLIKEYVFKILFMM